MNLSRVEIDIMQHVDLDKGLELAYAHKVPAIVVHQDLANETLIKRARMAGKYKIITPVDWPKGQAYSTNKMIGLKHETLKTDGFEILLTEKENINDIKAEVKAISNFITGHINKLSEVRFVLGVTLRPPEMISKMCEAIKSIPAPALIRTDHNTKLQNSKTTAQINLESISSIRAYLGSTIKISGNINSVKILDTYREHNLRFAVSVRQAEDIVRDYRNQIRQANESRA